MKATTEDEAKTATPQMEEFFLRLIADLHKWAADTNAQAVLDWFRKTVRLSDLVVLGFGSQDFI